MHAFCLSTLPTRRQREVEVRSCESQLFSFASLAMEAPAALPKAGKKTARDAATAQKVVFRQVLDSPFQPFWLAERF